MKKIFLNTFLLILLLLLIFILILSTNGIKTNKFNKLISNQISKTKNINLALDSIKFKIDLKELSLFLETQDPKIIYRGISLPAKNIKVYIDFLALTNSKPKIKKVNIISQELEFTQIKKLTAIIKPSNFKSILTNKIKKGNVISEFDIFLNKDGNIENFIAKGLVKNLEAQLINDFHFKDINLNFFADKNDILLKNIFGNLEEIKISKGNIKINTENGVKLSSDFNSILNFDEKILSKYTRFLNNIEFLKNIRNIKANFYNNFSINFDRTYKVKNYNYNVSGKINKSKIKLSKPFKNNFISEEFKFIYISDLKIRSNFSKTKTNFNAEGEYSFNNLDFQKIDLSNNFENERNNFRLNFDYENSFKLDIINYQKPKNSIANVNLDLEQRQDDIKINNLNYEEGKNSIKIYGLKLKKNKFLSFKNIEIATTNNNFKIKNNKKIKINGSKFDASNLAKFLSKQDDENKLQKLNGEIEIDFNEMKAPMSEKIQNFKLIGEIKKGKFIRISSKGDFGGNNYLDISMKKDKNSEKKYLEIYSDLTRPLLTEYSFFNGLSGGKLLFNTIIDGTKTTSKLKIENFKVVNAPGVIQLLSLADLRGLADLAEGEGLSFDVLEIDMEKNKNFLKLNEILALGPSISVLMEGYQDENGITSLKGSLVPAKTLNKMISKIPVIGKIVIPKEVGEGLFGISFKMKGPKGKIKTTINPIRTLTPRFIQKIVDRNKIAK